MGYHIFSAPRAGPLGTAVAQIVVSQAFPMFSHDESTRRLGDRSLLTDGLATCLSPRGPGGDRLL